MLTDYTTFADVRAALGVNEDDIQDSVLSLSIYNILLTQDFEDIDVTIESVYATKSALTSPTAAESRFIDACRLFATFSIANQLTITLPLFAAQQITDGKAQVNRFDNPYKDVMAYVLGQYDRARNKLKDAFEAVGETLTVVQPKLYFKNFAPATDPVTGS